TAWLYEFWHSGFPIAIILYVVLKDREWAGIVPRGSRRTDIVASVAIAIALVAMVTWISTAWEPYLPRIFLDRTTQTPLAPYINGIVFLLSAVALVMLWYRKRSVLDLWLMVAMCAWLLDIILQTLTGVRFTLGFYASRVCMVITATSVLVVLLWETMTL